MIDRYEFRNWLLRQSFNKAFLPGNICKCPLARFLEATDPRPGGRWTVNGRTASPNLPRPDPNGAPIVMPLWAQNFVALFDATYKNVIVGPAEALQILEQVPKA